LDEYREEIRGAWQKRTIPWGFVQKGPIVPKKQHGEGPPTRDQDERSGGKKKGIVGKTNQEKRYRYVIMDGCSGSVRGSRLENVYRLIEKEGKHFVGEDPE